MAPNQASVEWQTNQVIECLLEDEPAVVCSPCSLSNVEADGPADSGDNFDPAAVAEKLKSIADSFNDNMAFKEALDTLKKEVAQEAMESAFSSTVMALCQTRVPGSPEVSPELQLLKTSAAFGHLVAKSCPNLRRQISRTMIEFITRNLGGWIAQQGGWEGINI